MSDNKYTDFGFRKVLFSEKQSLVDRVFSNVSQKYDLMNDLMSLGAHRLWKKEFLTLMPDTSLSLLDVAGGSGDISLGYLKKAYESSQKPNVIISDINFDMLQSARDKLIDSNYKDAAQLVVGDAVKLPFPDNSFDYLTIAFGIRNVPDIKGALYEFYRVLKPSGKFLCLEFSKVDDGLFSEIYNFYSFSVIPKIGRFVARDEEAYQYLVESIKKFPSQDRFKSMMESVEFKGVGYKSLTKGVVAIHWGYKLEKEYE